MNVLAVVAVTVAFASGGGFVSAKVVYVDPDGSDANGDGATPATAFSSLPRALQSVRTGDTVALAARACTAMRAVAQR